MLLLTHRDLRRRLRALVSFLCCRRALGVAAWLRRKLDVLCCSDRRRRAWQAKVADLAAAASAAPQDSARSSSRLSGIVWRTNKVAADEHNANSGDHELRKSSNNPTDSNPNAVENGGDGRPPVLEGAALEAKVQECIEEGRKAQKEAVFSNVVRPTWRRSTQSLHYLMRAFAHFSCTHPLDVRAALIRVASPPSSSPLAPPTRSMACSSSTPSGSSWSG